MNLALYFGKVTSEKQAENLKTHLENHLEKLNESGFFYDTILICIINHIQTNDVFFSIL